MRDFILYVRDINLLGKPLTASDIHMSSFWLQDVSDVLCAWSANPRKDLWEVLGLHEDAYWAKTTHAEAYTHLIFTTLQWDNSNHRCINPVLTAIITRPPAQTGGMITTGLMGSVGYNTPSTSSIVFSNTTYSTSPILASDSGEFIIDFVILPPEKKKPAPALPLEVYHTKAFDSKEAWEATKLLCQGQAGASKR